MKITFALFLFLIAAKTSHAGDTLYFAGTIKISKSISYKYYLRFFIADDNHINGYSLSDPGGQNETKTKISGLYDSAKKTISFEESSVLRSKVDLKNNDLCFVHATLTLSKTKLVETLSGKFTGFKFDKTSECANGVVHLINTDRAKVILKQWDEQDKFHDNTKRIATETQGKLLTLSTEKGKTLAITGNSIKLSLWDNGQVDGDRIAVTLNGKYILEDYSLTAAIKVLDITLSDSGTDTLKVTALNEGTISPNTAAIKIESPWEQYSILTKAVINEVRTIYLTRKKPD